MFRASGIAIVAIAFWSTNLANAAAPGDPCSVAGGYTRSTDTAAAYHLVCDGSQWNLNLTLHKDGPVGIGTVNPSPGLTLDVEGKVGATDYCDEDGENCFTADSVGGGSAVAAGPEGAIQFNNSSALSGDVGFIYTSPGHVKLTNDATTTVLTIESTRPPGGSDGNGEPFVRFINSHNTGSYYIGINQNDGLSVGYRGSKSGEINSGDRAFVVNSDRSTSFLQMVTVGRSLAVGPASASETALYVSSGGTENSTAKLHLLTSGVGNASPTISNGHVLESHRNGSNQYEFSIRHRPANRQDFVLTHAGNAGFGTSEPGAKLQVNPLGPAVIGQIIRGATSQTANLQEWQNSAGATLAVMSASGAMGIGKSDPGYALDVVGDIAFTGDILDVSDRRLKDNIESLPTGQLEKLMALQGVSFTMQGSKKTELGLIAQDVEPHYPDLVQTRPDGTKTMSYLGFIAPLIEALKEQQSQIDTLQQQIELLQHQHGEAGSDPAAGE